MSAVRPKPPKGTAYGDHCLGEMIQILARHPEDFDRWRPTVRKRFVKAKARLHMAL